MHYSLGNPSLDTTQYSATDIILKIDTRKIKQDSYVRVKLRSVRANIVAMEKQ